MDNQNITSDPCLLCNIRNAYVRLKRESTVESFKDFQKLWTNFEALLMQGDNFHHLLRDCPLHDDNLGVDHWLDEMMPKILSLMRHGTAVLTKQ